MTASMINATIEKNPKALEERKIRYISLRQKISNQFRTDVRTFSIATDRGPYNIGVWKIKEGLRNWNMPWRHKNHFFSNFP